jgi:type IV fimbrial biogenesis protein FimT
MNSPAIIVRTKRKQRMSGFTLIELMVVVAIVAILAAIAFPNFQSLIQNNRIQAASSEFQAGLAMARAEAIKRGGDARVALVPNTVGTTKVWSNGFTVFYDKAGNANADVAPLVDSPNVTILMVTSALNSNITTAPQPSGSTNPHIIFNGLGRPIKSDGQQNPVSFVFQAATTGSGVNIRCLIMNAAGRTRSARYSEAGFAAISNSCGT